VVPSGPAVSRSQDSAFVATTPDSSSATPANSNLGSDQTQAPAARPNSRARSARETALDQLFSAFDASTAD
jgi:hypothetical protein